MYPEGNPPIEITSQNTTHVGFKVVNSWNRTFEYFYTEYHAGSFGETECLEEENIQSHLEVDEYLATCMHNVPISIVNIWVVDGNRAWFDEMDDAEVPECCHPPDFSSVPVVQYTFKLSCKDPCPTVARHLAAKTSSEEKKVNLHSKSSSSDKQFHVEKNKFVLPNESADQNSLRKDRPSQVVSSSEPTIDARDGHFCVSEDYPCGENNDRVHVCHYSARDGYKTFCVPEADSDVLAFYKKDYCGPCVGGYGGSTKKKKRTWL